MSNMTFYDTNIFSLSMNNRVTLLFDSVGLVYQDHGATYVYRNSTPITAMMFNVRNVLSDTSAYLCHKYFLFEKWYNIHRFL